MICTSISHTDKTEQSTLASVEVSSSPWQQKLQYYLNTEFCTIMVSFWIVFSGVSNFKSKSFFSSTWVFYKQMTFQATCTFFLFNLEFSKMSFTYYSIYVCHSPQSNNPRTHCSNNNNKSNKFTTTQSNSNAWYRDTIFPLWTTNQKSYLMAMKSEHFS